MELLQKISKKYLFLSFTTLILTMSVVSCECGGGDVEKGELELTFDKGQLRGAHRQTNLSMKAIRATRLAGLKLVASLTSNSAAGGKAKFTVGATSQTVTIGTDSNLALHTLLGLEENEELTEGDNKSIAITLEPTTEKDLTLTVEVKNDKDDVVGSSQKVEWKAENVLLAFTTPADDRAVFTADNEYELMLKNTGDQVDSDALMVELTSSDADVTFSLGGKNDAHGKNLTHLLGSKVGLANNDVKAIKIKKAAVNGGKTTATATIAIKHQGAEVGKRVITWKAEDVQLVFTKPPVDKEVFIAGNVQAIEIKNAGTVKVNSSAYTIKLGVTGGMEVKLGKKGGVKDGDEVNMNDIVAAADLVAGTGAISFDVKVTNDGGQKASEVKLTLMKGADEIATRILKWKAEDVRLEFTTPSADNEGFIAGGVKAIEIKNAGATQINSSAYTIKLGVTGGMEVQLGNKSGVKNNEAITMNDIVAAADLVAGTGAISFDVKVTNDGGQKASDVKLTLMKGADEIATRILKWKAEDVRLAFTTPSADNEEFIAGGVRAIRIKNKGVTKINSSAYTIKLGVTGVMEVKLGKKSGVKNGDTVNMDDIVDAVDLSAGTGSILFDVQVTVNGGQKASEIKLTLMKGTDEIATRVLRWKAEDVRLAFTNPNVDNKQLIAGDTQGVEIKNKGVTKVNSSAYKIKLGVIDGMEVKLGKKSGVKNGDTVNMDDIVDAVNDMADNKGSILFDVQVTVNGGQKASEIKLTLMKGADEIATRVLRWKAEEAKFKFNTPADRSSLVGNADCQIEIENLGMDVSTDDLYVAIGNGKELKFTVNGHEVDQNGQSLTTLLGGQSVKKINDKVAFTLKLDKAGGIESQSIFILIKHQTKVITTMQLNWKKS